MTTPQHPTARKTRMLLWFGAACLAGGWIAEIVAVALGMAVAWPNWLMLVAASGLLVSNVLRSTRPRASDYLVVAMAVLSVAAIIGIVAARP